MAVGLKLRDVRRFGTKLQKGVGTFARKLGKTADIVGSVASPIASIVAGRAGEEAVEQAIKGVKSGARQVERLTDKGVGKGLKGFKTLQQGTLGAQELARGVKGAVKNPQEAKMRIGDTLVNRFGKKAKPSIQRESEPTDSAPDLPFAFM
jgi:hypothetical protein